MPGCTVLPISSTLCRKERKRNWQDNHAHHRSNENQRKSRLHVIHKGISSCSHHHGIGRHADWRSVSAGAADDTGHQNCSGVRSHSLRNGKADGNHQRGSRCIGHKICHYAAKHKHYKSQDIRRRPQIRIGSPTTAYSKNPKDNPIS